MTKEKKGSAPTPTKGKGGGKGSGKDIDLKDCPLEFKQFSVENPKYLSILKEGENIGLEDLDSLQFELEALLSKAVVRTKKIRF
ncbi:transcriptional adapter 3-B-like [Eurytemora carolleeae]|uniref:transcriptional adapter 3-B-like n=1 Tax=Eurytemora carolleeae TaxID=1294199 RepID=UPI000C77917C|nr:transcriptional adapter 3-B-like [Eurytemora carolleeae]|eukprot:XP_023321858.1 transcriptional adapter 3-B-like [Eurytemora affinis]